jgi:hypothetical protein
MSSTILLPPALPPRAQICIRYCSNKQQRALRHGTRTAGLFYRPTRRPRRTSLPLECNRNATNRTRFKRAAFYQSLKSKVGLAAAKPAALRINLNVEGCGIVAAPVHAPSRAPLLLPLLLSHNLPPPRSLVPDEQTSPLRPRLVISRSTCPPLSPSPHANSFVIGTAVINTHTTLARLVPQGGFKYM